MGVSLALLAIVLFMPEYNGCKRWIVLPGLGTLQPSEIAKFAVVLVFAHIISLNHDRMQTFATGVLPFMVILGAVTVLMLLEPHLSGTLLILGIGAVLMFVGGTGLKWFALAGIAGAGAIAAAVVLLPELVPYAMGRLSSWRDPFADPLGEGHQTIQSLYAIASGGAAGLGLGNSRQKYLYVPEPQNDFIFSILCEELGFVGAALTVVLFLLLFLRGMSIAVRARDKFGALLAVGFVVQVVLQAVLNIAVVTNTIPNTGMRQRPFWRGADTRRKEQCAAHHGGVGAVPRHGDAHGRAASVRRGGFGAHPAKRGLQGPAGEWARRHYAAGISGQRSAGAADARDALLAVLSGAAAGPHGPRGHLYARRLPPGRAAH